MEMIPKSGMDTRRTPADEQRFTDLHDSNLHDQDENQAGDTYDLATGEKIDNSTDTGMGDLTIVREISLEGDDQDGDEAAKWLEEAEEKLLKSQSPD